MEAGWWKRTLVEPLTLRMRAEGKTILSVSVVVFLYYFMDSFDKAV